MPNTPIAQQLQQRFIQHYGEFRTDDFITVATELGFQLSPTPATTPKLNYHSQQQPGTGY